MKLPNVPYTPKVVRNALPRFGGLNFTEGFSEGELLSCENLSARKYPCLSSAPAPSPVTPEGEGVTDAHYIGGTLLAVKGGGVYLDGEYICPAESDKVQAAAVNTKIFIIPGNYMYDTVTKTCEKTDLPKEYSSCSYTRDGDEITITIPYAGAAIKESSFGGGAVYGIYTYGNTTEDREALADCFNENTHEWDRTALAALSNRAVFRLNDTSALTPGLCFIPNDNENFDYFINNYRDTRLNTTGKIGILLSRTVGHGLYHVRYRIIEEADTTPPSYIDGDVLTLSETPGGVWDGAIHVLSASADDALQTVAVTAQGSDLEDVKYYHTLSVSVSAGATAMKIRTENPVSSEYYYRLTSPQLSAGTTLYAKENLAVEGNKTLYYKDGNEIRSVELTKVNNPSATYELSFTAFPSAVPMIIERKMPRFDYICERENRLCGVSNEDGTVYVSALGLPQVFYDAAGDEGSYSVVVATPGDFTGICSYGGALCCFKGNGVFKLMGAVPSEYYSASYEFSGVARGAFRTLTQINGYLYYLSGDGVYVYSGSYPRKISGKLPKLRLTDAAAGFDGGGYVLAGENASGEGVTLRYDLDTGIWLSPFKGAAEAFFKTESGFYAVMDGRIFDVLSGAAFGEFEARLTPFFETAVTRRGYLRIVIRAEIACGAYLEAFISCDGAPWRSCGMIRAARDGLYSLPLKPGRCDKFELKLRGEGDVTVRELVREYIQTEG